MKGTRLVVSYGDTLQEATIRCIKKTTVTFVLVGSVSMDDITGLTVIRGNEAQDGIQQHLYIGMKLLTSKNAFPGGLQFGADILDLPTISSQEHIEHVDQEHLTASKYGDDTVFVSKAVQAQAQQRYTQVLDTQREIILEDMVRLIIRFEYSRASKPKYPHAPLPTPLSNMLSTPKAI